MAGAGAGQAPATGDNPQALHSSSGGVQPLHSSSADGSSSVGEPAQLPDSPGKPVPLQEITKPTTGGAAAREPVPAALVQPCHPQAGSPAAPPAACASQAVWPQWAQGPAREAAQAAWLLHRPPPFAGPLLRQVLWACAQHWGVTLDGRWPCQAALALGPGLLGTQLRLLQQQPRLYRCSQSAWPHRTCCPRQLCTGTCFSAAQERHRGAHGGDHGQRTKRRAGWQPPRRRGEHPNPAPDAGRQVGGHPATYHCSCPSPQAIPHNLH